MAYEIEFTAELPVGESHRYINECCWGGDIVRNRLIGAITSFVANSGAEYLYVQSGQEDWGWFIWVRCDSLQLATDIYCDDKNTGHFRIHVYGRKRKPLFRWENLDSPYVTALKSAVVEAVQDWGKAIRIARYTPDFMTELPD